MNIARLNFSHGTHAEHEKVVKRIRAAESENSPPVAILQDLKGLKIRIGPLPSGPVMLKTGSVLTLTVKKVSGDSGEVQVMYPGLIRDTKTGDTILMDDGLLELRVIKKERHRLLTRVIEGGLLREKKGVNLPGSAISGAIFTKQDREDLKFGISIGIDYVAISFVRSKQDILTVKKWLKKNDADIPVIAKIEQPRAVDNIDGIIAVSDGLMIARGDLGVEMNPERVPLIQKEIIRKCNAAMKPVITATQMLESMTEQMRPTRAEAADVANAVLDGTDALMLSAETSIGKHPQKTLVMMDRIIRHTESQRSKSAAHDIVSGSFPQAIAEAACNSAADIKAKTIVAFSRSGFTAQLLSAFRPEVPITGFTIDERTCRKMSLYWGVSPYTMKFPGHTDEMIAVSEKTLLEKRIAKKGDAIVIIASSPFTLGGNSNIMKLHKISR